MSKPNKDKKPWDMLTDEETEELPQRETGNAHTALTTYLEMTPSERNLGEVARICGNSKSWVEKWSSMFEWKKRTEAYDEYMNRQRLKIQKDRIEEAQALISDELLTMIRTYINKALTGDITGPQASSFRDLLDRAGLKVIEEHSHEVDIVDPEVLDSIFGRVSKTNNDDE